MAEDNEILKVCRYCIHNQVFPKDINPEFMGLEFCLLHHCDRSYPGYQLVENVCDTFEPHNLYELLFGNPDLYTGPDDDSVLEYFPEPTVV